MPAPEQRLEAEQLRLVYGQTWIAVFGGLVAAGIFAHIFRDAAPKATLVSWFCLLCLIYAGRSALYVCYRKRTAGGELRRWARAHLTGTLATSLAWGAAPLIVTAVESQTHMLIAALWVLGLSAASISAYSAHLPTLFAFFLPMTVPTCVYLLFADDRTTAGVGLGLVTYVLVSVRAMLPVNRSIVDAIRLNMALGQEVEERIRIEQKLRELSRRDGLTGIANRHCFDETLLREWRRARREVHPLSLVLMDVDYFKAYNDTYGHPDGDVCLKRVSSALQAAVRRPGDLVARYGGEELAVLLPDTSADSAMRIAQSLRKTIESMAIPHAGTRVEGCKVLTVSAGVATAVPQQAAAPADLLTSADKALYRAKAAGRNTAMVGATPTSA